MRIDKFHELDTSGTNSKSESNSYTPVFDWQAKLKYARKYRRRVQVNNVITSRFANSTQRNMNGDEFNREPTDLHDKLF